MMGLRTYTGLEKWPAYPWLLPRVRSVSEAIIFIFVVLLPTDFRCLNFGDNTAARLKRRLTFEGLKLDERDIECRQRANELFFLICAAFRFSTPLFTIFCLWRFNLWDWQVIMQIIYSMWKSTKLPNITATFVIHLMLSLSVALEQVKSWKCLYSKYILPTSLISQAFNHPQHFQFAITRAFPLSLRLAQ